MLFAVNLGDDADTTGAVYGQIAGAYYGVEKIPISLENAASVALNLVARGMHVVIDYPLGAEDHQYLLDRLAKTGEMVHTFTLSPSLSVAVKNRGNRDLSAREKRRIREQYEGRKSHPPVGLPIDSTHQTPEETAETIVKELGLM